MRNGRILFWGLILLQFFHPAPLISADPKIILQEANAFVFQKEYQQAIPAFESILSEFPASSEAKMACLILPVCYAAAKQEEGIEKVCQHALRYFSSDIPYTNRIRQTLGDFYFSRKEYDKSRQHFQAVLQTNPDYRTVLSLYEKIASGYAAADQPDKAAATLQALLKEHPGLVDRYSTDTSTRQYYRLRAEVDRNAFTGRTLSRIADFYEKSGQPDSARAAYALLTDRFPDSPYSIKASLRLAEDLAGNNKSAEAVSLYLKSIIDSTRPLFPFKAHLPENRDHLDDLNKERLTSTEAGMAVKNLCLLLDSTLSETRLADIQSRWQKTHAFVEAGQYDEAVSGYREMATDTRSPVNVLARYLTASCRSQQGDYHEALATLGPFLEESKAPAIKATLPDTPSRAFQKELTRRALYLAGSCYFHQGRYPQAEILLRKTAGFSPAADYRLAQTCEFQGKVTDAVETYQNLGAISDQELADLSRFAISRVNSLRESLSSLSRPKNPAVVFFGEDRTTQGNWPDRYGKYFHILCGMAGHFDITGGEAKERFRTLKETKPNVYAETPKYAIYTGNPDDPARHWISKLRDDSPVFLVNPLTGTRRPANWDDHGEAHPVGKGPDFFLDLTIPEKGLFLLSLYFVNDPCYYEPNREYTIYVLDKDTGDVLSAASVENFETGVYKRFLVEGQKPLTFRICRNLSLNTLVSGVFIDRLLPNRALPKDFEIRSSEIGTAAKTYANLISIPMSDPRSFLQRESDWLGLKEALAALAGRPLSLSDDFLRHWMLYQTGVCLNDNCHLQQQAETAVRALSAWLAQDSSDKTLASIEQLIRATFKDDPGSLGAKMAEKFLDVLTALPRDRSHQHLIAGAERWRKDCPDMALMAYRRLAGTLTEKDRRAYLCLLETTYNASSLPIRKDEIRKEILAQTNQFVKGRPTLEKEDAYFVFIRFHNIREEASAEYWLHRLLAEYPFSDQTITALAKTAYYHLPKNKPKAMECARLFLTAYPDGRLSGRMQEIIRICESH